MEELKNVDAYNDLKKAIAAFTLLFAAALCQYIKANEKEFRDLLEDKTEVKNND